ncbi:MAG: glycosyltransferase [Phycisphaerae bacterium]|nr:glycosyltransferase [Phycisphaerae bacterium]
MNVALVHDWLTGMRGGERVLLAIGRMFPRADLFTLFQVPGQCGPIVEGRRVVSSWLDRLPGIRRYYRYLLPVMPWAIQSLDLRGYDLILSNSHCVAKGVRRPRGAVHICYCHSPMRYVWSQVDAYRQAMGLTGLALHVFRDPLRRWDRRTAAGVDLFVANSVNVAQRISRSYSRRAVVIYPPVDTEFYSPAAVPREEFYLAVGAMAPYKRLDQAVGAFARLPDRQLRVIGSGQMAAKLRRSAPPNVVFLGWQTEDVIRDHYRRCRALLYPGEEDFGIVPVEAMACGCPVIAYRGGGAVETVVDVKEAGGSRGTGLWYTPQTVEALVDAIGEFEKMGDLWDAGHIAQHAQQFSQARFCKELRRVIETVGGNRPC